MELRHSRKRGRRFCSVMFRYLEIKAVLFFYAAVYAFLNNEHVKDPTIV